MQPKQNYDFIMGGGQGAKPPSPLGGSDSMKGRLIFLGGIGVVVIFLIIIVTAMFSGGGEARDAFLRVQQAQAETARITDASIQQDISGQELKNVVVNANLTATSDRQALALLLGSWGISFNDKELAGGYNAEVDSQIESATAAGLLDETVHQLLLAQLENYSEALALAFESTSAEDLRDELTDQYDSIELLLTQLKKIQI